ncbi:MAG: hypothetical protein K2W85_09640 [Phycisphaerales bacterium]|nr:hypothetical protein [Phycisphaerales bacterium]
MFQSSRLLNGMQHRQRGQHRLYRAVINGVGAAGEPKPVNQMAGVITLI